MPLAKLPDGFPEPEPPPKRFWEDEKWIGENIMDLMRQYPDQWIAVLDKEVVAASKHRLEVNRVAKQKEAEADQGQCVYEFIEGGVRFYASSAVIPDPN